MFGLHFALMLRSSRVNAVGLFSQLMQVSAVFVLANSLIEEIVAVPGSAVRSPQLSAVYSELVQRQDSDLAADFVTVPHEYTQRVFGSIFVPVVFLHQDRLDLSVNAKELLRLEVLLVL